MGEEQTEYGALTGEESWGRYHEQEFGQVGELGPGKLGELHEVLRRYLPRGPKRLVEIGAAPGRYLAYFHRYFGYNVTGVENCPVAVKAMRENLTRWGVPATVVEADAFAFCQTAEKFNVVVSMGFVEHFARWREVVGALASLVGPGGVMATGVPNLRGANGWICRLMRPGRYRGCVPIRLGELAAAHRRAGLRVRWAGYYGGWAVNPLVRESDLGQRAWGGLWRLNAATRALNRAGDWWQAVTGRTYRGALWSPRLMVIARRGEESGVRSL